MDTIIPDHILKNISICINVPLDLNAFENYTHQEIFNLILKARAEIYYRFSKIPLKYAVTLNKCFLLIENEFGVTIKERLKSYSDITINEFIELPFCTNCMTQNQVSASPK